MEIKYDFYNYGEDGPVEENYYFNTDMVDYIENTYSMEELLDLYVKYAWPKEEIKQSFKDAGIDINSEEELRDYAIYMDDTSWIIEDLLDILGEDYFYDDIDTPEFYKEEAYDEYMSDLDVQNIEDEDAHRYNYDRHYY
jgi:hypothetical protein